MKRRSTRRPLQLSGKEWLRRSISVWNDVEKTKEEKALKHPALFPEELVSRLIGMFSPDEADLIIDPFCGSGSTLLAARRAGRPSVGIDLSATYIELAKQRLAEVPGPEADLHCADARQVSRLVPREAVQLAVTSPPYWNVLSRKRSADHRVVQDYEPEGRPEAEQSYDEYLTFLTEVAREVLLCLKPGGYFVVNVMDLRKGPQFFPVHMDVAYRLRNAGYLFDDLIIWDRRRDYNSLRPLGYPYVFRVNKIHEYLLIFQRPRE